MKVQFRVAIIVALMFITKNLMKSQSCSCTDYIYLNDANTDVVHKFSVNPDNGVLTEIGSPWLPYNAIDQLIGSPHGIATDVNGNLYISSRSTYEMYKLKCDGTIVDFNPSTSGIDPIFDGFGFNFFSIGNIMYISQNDNTTQLDIMDLCTGESIGCVALPTGLTESLWGLTKGYDGKWYGTNTNGQQILSGPLDTSFYGSPCTQNVVDIVCTAADLGLPNAGLNTWGFTGIVQIPDSTIYVQWSADNGFYSPSTIYHIDINTCTVLDQSLTDYNSEFNDLDGLNWSGARGLTYSPSANLIYAASAEDCVAAFDLDLNYVESASNHIRGEYPKAIGLTTECCPTITPLTFDVNVCATNNGERLFLQDLFDCGMGIICEGMWAETSNTSGGNIVFNECDLSIIVSGEGCAEYTLEKSNSGSANQQCSAFTIILNICAQSPTATISALQGTCSSLNPNNDASILVSMASSNIDQAGISLGSTYTGPNYNDESNIPISSGNGVFENLSHNSQYTVRVFGGSDDCFMDYTISTPSVVCCAINLVTPQNIECFDNGTPSKITDNQVRFTATIINSDANADVYTVSVDHGTTITPSSGTYSNPTIFTLGNGTGGGGNTFTITVTDASFPDCNQTFQVMDPGGCLQQDDCIIPKCGNAETQINGD